LIALLQRVGEARVTVGSETVAAIGGGILALIGVERNDAEADADRLLERLLGYRVFEDESGRMNRNLAQVGGGLLLVPQFTLAADTRKGMRPSFTPAAAPDRGAALFDHLVRRAAADHSPVAAGRFGAHMQVHLVNDGPVTFWLQTGQAR
jgi:D-tyrosyl-tRNA(Tyr) deacylase